MLPTTTEIWTLELPNGVRLIAVLRLCRHKAPELRHKFRMMIQLTSPSLGKTMDLPSSLNMFGMPPEFRDADAAFDDSRRLLRLLGFAVVS